MRKYLHSCFILLIISVETLFSMVGNNYRFMHITGRDGLPHQQVEALMQDDKGMLWIGTRNGLSRYNGYELVSYFNQAANPNSLNQNFIRAIFQDSKKRIWIGTYDGICRYRPASDDFKSYNLRNTTITSIAETSDGRIFCSGTELYEYDEEKAEFVLHKRKDSEFIISMAVDKQDRLFISTNKSISYYDSSFTKTTQINPDYYSGFLTGADGILPLYFDSKGLLWIGRNGKGVMNIDLATGATKVYEASRLSDGTVRVISEDSNNRMWLGTEKGITLLNPDGSVEMLQQDFVDKNKLNDNAIYAIVNDRDGNTWIGTYFGGINVLLKNNEQFNWVEPGYSASYLKGKAIRKIVEPHKNMLWIATEDGGLNVFNTITGNITVVDKIKNLGHNIHELFYDSVTSDMWIGTFRNGLFRYNLSTGNHQHYLPGIRCGLSSDAIFSIVKQQNGRMWVGTTQGLRYYDEKNDRFLSIDHPVLDVDFIYSLLVDKDDNIWIGTRNNGLFRINKATNEVNSWARTTSHSQLKDNYITSLYQDAGSRIWIGTNNAGIQYIDPEELEIRDLGDELSLSKNTICSTLEDEFGRLWISTSQGLYQFNKDRSAYVYYTIEQGLPVNQFNFASSLRAQNGYLYFGSVNGLISLLPSKIKVRKSIFEVHLFKLNINNQTVSTITPGSPLTAALDEVAEISLSYNQSRSFSIEYAAVSLGNTSSLYYQVRLLGSHDNWINAGQERKFVGSNLSPGTYRLQLRANNSNEGWEEEPVKELKIIIRPPFYLSIWAFLVYLLLAGLIIYFSIRVFSIRIKERNAVRIARLEKEKLEEINTVKMDFFTSISHELKTPLSLIMAPLKHIAQQGILPEELSQKLGVAIKNTHKMTSLIEELVTFNKVESGNFQFYIRKANPLEFIENVAQLFLESAGEKSVSLYVHCENNGEDVWFSPSYVEKIVNNLLSNAIKFTAEQGKIYVNASITDNADGYTYLSIEVKDTGIGIAQEELENIFDKYYQTRRGHKVNSKGWGLGLALVKKLVSIHKGSISVESAVGKGSCFTVQLNVSEAAFGEAEKISADKTGRLLQQYEFDTPQFEHSLLNPLPPASRNATSGFSILLVEDNIELLNFLSETFGAKYKIYVAENGVEALAIARKYPVDIIISDVMMPEMDGNTLCQKVKNDLSTSHIPVILLTAKNETDDIMKGYESGAEAYVAKPFDPHILELQVKNILQMKEVQRKRIIENPESEVEPEALSRFDREFISKVNNLISENMENDQFSVVDITKSIGISRSVLHVKMKSLLNISMGDYIRKRRLNRACELLHDGYNISETAYQTGFSDPNYFSRCFKKEFGITPTEYQKS